MDKVEEQKTIPVSIRCGFHTLEQKLIFEAVVLPEISAVLEKYAPLLGYSGN